VAEPAPAPVRESSRPPAHCLVHAAYSFNGRGPSHSCASIVAHFPTDLSTEVFIPRARTPLSRSVHTREALPPIVRRLPWRFVEGRAADALDQRFAATLRDRDPGSSVVYVWPGAPLWLVRDARERGFPVVREMTNCACATSGPLLDAAYDVLGLAPTHGVTAQVIEDESLELREYDYIFAPNPEVEASLSRLGIPAERILPTSFGWNPDRFRDSVPETRLDHGVRALFVGSISVRKGIPDLLAAWRDAQLDGELVLVGRVEPAIAELVDQHLQDGRVRLAGYLDDVGSMYLASDLFVFPTLEEGGPQVTYEAAGCGLPVITTPMGTARLVEGDHSGIVVDARDRDQLFDALRRLGSDADLRSRYGAAAKAAASDFDYRLVGRTRGEQLSDIARGQPSTRGATGRH
jgi:glycosyltransferase involved in cell wall biosynthesis